MKIDLTNKVKVFLNFLFVGLILFNIIIDLYHTGSVDYGVITWLVIMLLFNNVIE